MDASCFRVSNDRQTTENQFENLLQVAGPSRRTARLALDEFRHLRIDFVSLREAIDTSMPLGKAMFTMIGAMAELGSVQSGPELVDK